MGFGQALCLALIVGCAHQVAIPDHRARIAEAITPRAPIRVLSPESAQPKPWAVAQWATYKLTLEGEPAYDRLSIVAEDACGTWVELVRETAKHRDMWLACVRADAQGRWHTRQRFSERDGVVKRESFDEKSDDHWPVAGFIPLPRPEGATGESLDVAAGHFEGAIRVGADWVHPSVPLSGRVKTLGPDGTTSELVAFGEKDEPSVVGALVDRVVRTAHEDPVAHAFVSLGVGLTTPHGYGRDEIGTGGTLRVRGGGRVGRRFEIYGEGVLELPHDYKPDPTQNQARSSALVGVRWNFYGWPRRGWARPVDFYLRGGIGLGTIERTGEMIERVTDHGLGVNLAVGMNTQVAPGCGIALEVIDDVFIDSAGVRHGLGGVVALQVQLPVGPY